MKKIILSILLSAWVAFSCACVGNVSTQDYEKNNEDSYHGNSIKVADSDESMEKLKELYPYMDDYLLTEMYILRKTGKVRTALYLKALSDGRESISTPRLKYSDVERILEECGITEPMSEENEGRCEEAISRILQIQKYPDVLTDFHNLSLKDGFEHGSSIMVFLTDDPERPVTISGRTIHCGIGYLKSILLAGVPMDFTPSTINMDYSIFYHYDSSYYDNIRARTEKACSGEDYIMPDDVLVEPDSPKYEKNT